MAARLRLAGQAFAVAAVAALLALLIWKVLDERASSPAAELARGKTPPAPNFTLPRLDRSGELSLASLRGQGVVLNFWASWCDPCEEEAPVLEAAWRKYRSRGLVVVGVDHNDFKGDARRFARKNGMTYPLVHDGRGELLENGYAGTGVPETYFVNRRGRLVGEPFLGPLNHDTGKFERYIELALSS